VLFVPEKEKSNAQNAAALGCSQPSAMNAKAQASYPLLPGKDRLNATFAKVEE